MVKKNISKRNSKISRQDLADPFREIAYQQMLVDAKSINIEDNHTIEYLKKGYIRIKIFDKNKLAK